jgi:hypothetical protein
MTKQMTIKRNIYKVTIIRKLRIERDTTTEEYKSRPDFGGNNGEDGNKIREGAAI